MEHLLKSALGELDQAFKNGDRSKARLLLRLFAALVPSNALHASSVLKALNGIVESAIEIADAGEAHNFISIYFVLHMALKRTLK